MTTPGDLELERIRCSAFRSASGADPIGTAAHHTAFLCVTVPLPWDRDISTSAPFSDLGGTPVLTGAGGRRWRAQGLAPVDPDVAVVLAYVAEVDPSGWVHPFRRSEWRIDPGQVAALCRAILDEDPSVAADFDHARSDVGDDVVDVLVCGHGRRDACCGSAGVALAGQFREAGVGDPGADGPVRVWRTSHLGGHRFAPTALTFPDGYAWAHLGPSDLAGLGTGRPVPLGSCRGWSAVGAGPAQVADREGLALVGPAWSSARRRVELTAHDRRTRSSTVAVQAALDAGSVELEVDVAVVDHLPQPTCGLIEQPEFGVEPVWAATDLRVLSDTRTP